MYTYAIFILLRLIWWGLDKIVVQRSVTLTSVIVFIKESEAEGGQRGLHGFLNGIQNTWL